MNQTGSFSTHLPVHGQYYVFKQYSKFPFLYFCILLTLSQTTNFTLFHIEKSWQTTILTFMKMAQGSRNW